MCQVIQSKAADKYITRLLQSDTNKILERPTCLTDNRALSSALTYASSASLQPGFEPQFVRWIQLQALYITYPHPALTWEEIKLPSIQT